jgi:pantetheine-phosphate adenylyltransferase
MGNHGLVAVYAGTFDPPTIGHEDLIKRALGFCEKLIIGIGVNSTKTPIFTVEERVEMLQKLADNPRVEVVAFQGLLVDFVRKSGGSMIIRGLRAVMDFEYEMGIAHANADQAPTVETVFLATKPQYSFISSSVVREVAKYGGSVRHYVSPLVEEALRAKFRK